jgi:hypothetical protein
VDAVLAGEASAGERKTLEELSAADPTVQTTIESRAALFDTLRRLRVAAPPSDLRGMILEAVGREAAQGARRSAVDTMPASRSDTPRTLSEPLARLFHPKRWRSHMANKQWILGGAVVLAAIVAVVALRNPGPKTNAQGTIGAANRYHSEQVAAKDVSLDDPTIASFIQSDTFRKLAASDAFREAAKTDAFSRIVGDDGLREAAYKHDLARVLENAHVAELLKSDAFAKGMTDALVHESLVKSDLAYLLEGSRLTELLKSEAFRDAGMRTEFVKVASEALKTDAVKIADFSRVVDGNATLRDADAMRTLEGQKAFVDALQHGFLELFRTPESANFTIEGLRSLAESRSLLEALRVEGFRDVMEGLNIDTFAAVREAAASATMVDLFRDGAFREAAARTELSRVADAGFKEALARIPE